MTVDGLASFYYTSLIIVILAIIFLSAYAIIKKKNILTKLALWLFGAIGIAALFSLLFIGTINYFNANSSCGICHEMKPEIVTFERSKHRNIRCVACHIEAENSVSFIIEKSETIKEVVNHIIGAYPAVINSDSSLSQKRMNSKVCLRCHRAIRPTAVFGDGMRINHSAHNKVRISCPTCHNRVTHKGARDFFYLDGLRMMDGCMRCHLPGDPKTFKGETAPTKCSTCHLDSNIAKKAFGTDKITSADFDKCDSCHKLTDPEIAQDFKQTNMFKKGNLNCQSCHNDHLSKTFIANPDPKKCNKCHEVISSQVIKKKHGEQIKSPFKKVSKVRCGFCHQPHKFMIPLT